MTKIELVMTDEKLQRRVDMSLETENNQAVERDLIWGVMAFMGFPEEKTFVVKTTPDLCKPPTAPLECPPPPMKPTSTFGHLLVPAPRPRVLPKVNEERTMAAPIGENEQFAKLAQRLFPTENPAKPSDHRETGIMMKTIDGKEVECYRVAYKCKCGEVGRRYMSEKANYTRCHKCDTRLEIRVAVIGKALARDGNGDFFIADKEFVEIKIPTR